MQTPKCSLFREWRIDRARPWGGGGGGEEYNKLIRPSKNLAGLMKVWVTAKLRVTGSNSWWKYFFLVTTECVVELDALPIQAMTTLYQLRQQIIHELRTLSSVTIVVITEAQAYYYIDCTLCGRRMCVCVAWAGGCVTFSLRWELSSNKMFCNVQKVCTCSGVYTQTH